MITCANALRLPYAAESFHLALGSPPYYGGIRVYHGEQETDWPEVEFAPVAGLPPLVIPAQHAALGHEPDPWAYVAHLVAIYRETRRVLRPDGLLVVQMGDVYSGGRRGPQGKNLLLMPQRVALALQADGWILRSRLPGGEIRPEGVWRSNKMPESCGDRPSKNYEDWFIFSREPRYFWDQENGREAGSKDSHGGTKVCEYTPPGDTRHGRNSTSFGKVAATAGRNMRAAWTPADALEYAPAEMRQLWDIPSEPTKEEHYAAWPQALAARLISIGTSDRGVCPECGAPWFGVVERREILERPMSRPGRGETASLNAGPGQAQRGGRFVDTATQGWRPGCSCYPDHDGTAPDDWPTARPRVLDIFGGIGRTRQAGELLGRETHLCDIHLGYCLTARRRTAAGLPVAKRVERGQASLFERGQASLFEVAPVDGLVAVSY